MLKYIRIEAPTDNWQTKQDNQQKAPTKEQPNDYSAKTALINVKAEVVED